MTPYNGTHFNKTMNKWQAQINVDGKRVFLGTFENQDDARCARILAEEKYSICKDIRSIKEFSPDDWKYFFIYENKSGRLINSVTRPNGAKKGFFSSTICSSGYMLVSINSKRYREHRIIWEMFNGEIPILMEIDHINRIRHDNRISNLRLATRHEQNLNLSKRESTDVTGVCFSKKDKRWQANIGFMGKRIHLGQFLNKTDAIQVRKEAEKNYGFRGQQ